MSPASKRKCTGTFPCERCIKLGKEDSCTPIVQKKRGRPSKFDVLIDVESAIANLKHATASPSPNNSGSDVSDESGDSRSSSTSSSSTRAAKRSMLAGGGGSSHEDSPPPPPLNTSAYPFPPQQPPQNPSVQVSLGASYFLPTSESQRTLLSMLLSHGQMAVATRPKDLANAFGIDLGPNFVVLQMHTSIPTFRDMAAMGSKSREELQREYQPMFFSSLVIAGQADGSIPEFVPEIMVGKKLQEIVNSIEDDCKDEDPRQIADIMSSFPGQPHVKTVDVPSAKSIVSIKGGFFKCKMRATFFFDEFAMIRYIFASILDTVPPRSSTAPRHFSSATAPMSSFSVADSSVFTPMSDRRLSEELFPSETRNGLLATPMPFDRSMLSSSLEQWLFM